MIVKKYIKWILLAFLLCNSVQAKDAVNIYDYPRPMPDRAIYNEAGQQVKIADFKGEFLLINLWSRHCTPCIKELESLNGFTLKTQGNGIRMILLSPEEEWSSSEEQRRFLEKFKAPNVEFYTDKDEKLADDLGVFTSPHTVLVNKKGEEIGRIRGSADWDEDDVIEYIYKLKAKHG